MQNTQIFALLLTLQPKEVRELRKFLDSPFFNHRKDVVRLFEYLAKKMAKGKTELDKEKVFRKVYPKERFTEQAFRQLLSWLQQLIEKYLAYKRLFDDDIRVKIQLAEVFRERDLARHFKKTIREAEKKLDTPALRNADYYEQRFALEFEKYNASSIQRMTSHNFQSISENLDWSYIIKKLQQVCFTIAHQTVYRIDYELGMFREVLNYIERNHLTEHPTIAAYWYCYYALSDPEREDNFFRFKELLVQNNQRFSLEELRNLYLLAINYCIRRLNAGHLAFAREGLDLYKNALQSEVLFSRGVLSRFTFRNIVAMGLKVKEYDWVEQFINRYQDDLEAEYKSSTYALNMATLAYTRRHLDRALELLQLSDYKDLLMNLSSKTLAAKIYYELREDMLLYSHLQTMEVFIRRKKVMGYHRKNYLNFIHYLKQLHKLPSFDHKRTESLRTNISEEEILTEREWFLQILEKE